MHAQSEANSTNFLQHNKLAANKNKSYKILGQNFRTIHLKLYLRLLFVWGIVVSVLTHVPKM